MASKPKATSTAADRLARNAKPLEAKTQKKDKDGNPIEPRRTIGGQVSQKDKARYDQCIADAMKGYLVPGVQFKPTSGQMQEFLVDHLCEVIAENKKSMKPSTAKPKGKTPPKKKS